MKGRKTLAFAALLATGATAQVDTAHAQVGPDTIAKFLFTSGSTKLPEGVINAQRMICSNQQMIRQCFADLQREPPVLVDWLPWNDTFGGNHNVGITVCNGGTLYIDEGKPTPALIGETLRNLREIAPTMYFNVAKGFEEIANALDLDPVLRETLFSRVKMFFFSGAGLLPPAWDKLHRVAEAHAGERVRMPTGLGMTETALFAVCANAHDLKSGHIGLPASGIELKVVPVGDPKQGAKPEMRYRGPNVTPGYWRALPAAPSSVRRRRRLPSTRCVRSCRRWSIGCMRAAPAAQRASRARARRTALDRPRRSHRQRLGQPARGADPSPTVR